MRTISTKELQDLFALLIKKLREENIDQHHIETDFYRIIPTDEWQSYEDNIIIAGSLYDDIDSLKKTLQKDGAFMYVDFDRLASVLRMISEIQNPVKK